MNIFYTQHDFNAVKLAQLLDVQVGQMMWFDWNVGDDAKIISEISDHLIQGSGIRRLVIRVLGLKSPRQIQGFSDFLRKIYEKASDLGVQIVIKAGWPMRVFRKVFCDYPVRCLSQIHFEVEDINESCHRFIEKEAQELGCSILRLSPFSATWLENQWRRGFDSYARSVLRIAIIQSKSGILELEKGFH